MGGQDAGLRVPGRQSPLSCDGHASQRLPPAACQALCFPALHAHHHHTLTPHQRTWLSAWPPARRRYLSHWVSMQFRPLHGSASGCLLTPGGCAQTSEGSFMLAFHSSVLAVQFSLLVGPLSPSPG